MTPETYIGQRWDEAMNAQPVSPFQPRYLPPAIPYEEFLKRKIELSHDSGWEIADTEINPWLKPHQRVAVRWGVKGGRRAWFMSFGLGKTVIQLETLRIILKRIGGRGLIVAPLGVRQEFKRDAGRLGIEIKFIRSIEECDSEGKGIYITNYETVRDGKLDPNNFTVTSLDEAAILRSFGGTLTFRRFMGLFENVKYKFVATATPSPNEYIELLAYAAYLGIMDVGAGKTRFFKRDSTKADTLTIHPHKEDEFRIWLSSWALFCPTPSIFGEGFSDEGYALPPMRVIHHEVKANHEVAVADRDGQMRMFRNSALGLTDAAREKRESLTLRVAQAAAIVATAPDDHWILWHDLENERRALEKAIPNSFSVYGSEDLDEREQRIIDFSEGKIGNLLAKSSIAGSGCNFQYHCHRAIFVGITFKFKDFLQAVMRIFRFLQTEEVEIHLIYAESERHVLKVLMEKWQRHNEQVEKMTAIIKEYGLSELALAQALTRSMGCERVEVSGDGYQLVNNDSIPEARNLPDNSLGLILTSIPFSTQYEYTPCYNDLGHSESNAQFFEQMDYLTPELYRALMPGRIAAIHVKDRTVPGGMTGMGFQSAYPFHADCIYHFLKHGFVFLGMKTIVTDVVRENNQTYRMGWSEQCKDATKMGYGMPEYLLVFRKPQTDRTKGYADIRVVKSKKRYSKARWQVDAHGFTRSNGDVPINPEEWKFLTHQKIFGMFHDWGLQNIYDFEYHVKLGESIMEAGRLPVTFMLLQPPSWHPDVWTDITRMITVNALQARKGKQMHLCLARDSMVLTKERGYVPIQDVDEGENVLSHKGRWRPVLIVKQTGIQEAITINAQGVPGLTLTPDHDLWTRKTDYARQRDYAEQIEPRWTEAQMTLGGYLNLKLPPTEKPSNEDLTVWWIVGRWLADGNWESRGCPIISCADDEVSEMIGHLRGRNGGCYRILIAQTCQQMRILDPTGDLKKILRKCGLGSDGKHLPPEAFTLPTEHAKALLEGYLSGDGHFKSDIGRWSATAVNRTLLLGMAVLAQRAYGSIASVYRGRDAGQCVIQGRTVNTKAEWIFCFYVQSENRKQQFILDDGAWKKVRSIEVKDEPVETWCLKVEEDESFTADGCIVKNCPMQFDLADRVITQMSNPGEIVADPFSGLGTVPMRAIALGRKAWGCELNPGYFLDSVGYTEAAARKMAMPTLFDMIEIGETQERNEVGS